MLTCIMDKMLAKINVLCTIAATNGAFGPMNASLIISENWSRTILLETKISKKFAEKDDFLNHRASSNELSFKFRQRLTVTKHTLTDVCSAKTLLPHLA